MAANADTTTTTNNEPVLNSEQVIGKYKQMQAECNQFVTKISELETERNEHDLVIKTLTPLNDDRKCLRLVGGVLVERTVGSVLPSVQANKDNLQNVLSNLEEILKSKQKSTVEWKVKYNIKTQDEANEEEKRRKQTDATAEA